MQSTSGSRKKKFPLAVVSTGSDSFLFVLRVFGAYFDREKIVTDLA
jgi:hypothetical protein